MKKGIVCILAIGTLVLVSCNKNKCYDCHYDGPNGEVELGEKCGDEVKELEENGHTVDGTNYTVHCGEH